MLLRFKQDEHGDLRDSDRQSVIPYVYEDNCYVCYSSLGLNLSKRECMSMLSVRPFII
jgi:hypothetical protein